MPTLDLDFLINCFAIPQAAGHHVKVMTIGLTGLQDMEKWAVFQPYTANPLHPTKGYIWNAAVRLDLSLRDNIFTLLDDSDTYRTFQYSDLAYVLKPKSAICPCGISRAGCTYHAP